MFVSQLLIAVGFLASSLFALRINVPVEPANPI